MAILSKKIIADVSRAYFEKYGLKPYFMDLSGRGLNNIDSLSVLSNTRRRRDYALQQSINLGRSYVFMAVPYVSTYVIGLEDKRMIHGSLIGPEVLNTDSIPKYGYGTPIIDESIKYLISHGMDDESAKDFISNLHTWDEQRILESSEYLQSIFYQISGWKPVLMEENRLKALQQKQINQAIEDLRKKGTQALYAFEKERILLSNIRAGDRNNARRILNDMLANIYMSSPQLVVLRARTIELISCLTRAAIEDNPLMEPLIERNHSWIERLIKERDFEGLSQVLMDALDDFIDEIYLHGVNRSNTKVRKALDYISDNFSEKLTLKMISDKVNLSSCRLSHLVKEFTGRTVMQIIQQVRIRYAQQLLERTSKSCTEIGYEVGFGDQSYFIKHFKRVTGTTPAKHRKSRSI